MNKFILIVFLVVGFPDDVGSSDFLPPVKFTHTIFSQNEHFSINQKGVISASLKICLLKKLHLADEWIRIFLTSFRNLSCPLKSNFELKYLLQVLAVL